MPGRALDHLASRRCWPGSVAAVLFAAASLVAATASGQQSLQQLILLDGKAIPFKALEISNGMLRGEGLPADLMLDDLRRIELAPSVPPEKPTIVAELRGGSRIYAKDLSIGEDKCQLAWANGEPLNVPVDLVRGIRTAPALTSADFEKALATPSAELDRVFVKDDAGKVTSVAGLIKSLTAQHLTIEIGAEVRTVPRQRVVGIVIAQPAPNDALAPCLITFRDGSTVGGESLALTEDKATVGFPAGASVSFAWSAVSKVAIRSSRVAFLSDLKPTAEEQLPLVTIPLPAQRDKSVLGKPLTLGKQVFEKGLGVHARSSLTFATDKKWDVLAATIGIDAEAAGKGDCVFSVLADGQPLFSRRLTGSDPPYEFELPIVNRSSITLVVEPGEGLDLADHADWCDARLVKSRPK